jgi:Flp pilus assembly pilin Flp
MRRILKKKNGEHGAAFIDAALLIALIAAIAIPAVISVGHQTSTVIQKIGNEMQGCTGDDKYECKNGNNDKLNNGLE